MVNFRVKDKRASTLIELLIYIAIIAMSLGSLMLTVFTITESRVKNYVVQEVNANARLALQIIHQTMRSANSVNIGSSTFGSDPGILTLEMSESAKNPTIIDLNQDDGTLRIKEGSSPAVNLTTDKINVTNLVFTNLTPTGKRNNIRVQMTLEYDSGTNDVIYNYFTTLQTAVNIRK